jgi:hypothetical protein
MFFFNPSEVWLLFILAWMKPNMLTVCPDYRVSNMVLLMYNEFTIQSTGNSGYANTPGCYVYTYIACLVVYYLYHRASDGWSAFAGNPDHPSPHISWMTKGLLQLPTFQKGIAPRSSGSSSPRRRDTYCLILSMLAHLVMWLVYLGGA